MTFLELATGYHPLAGMTEQNIAWQVTFGDDLSIPDDVDAQVRLLCQGLLVRDPAKRWGADEVQRWLDRDPPDLPEQRGPLVSEHTAFVFDEREHRERVPLAQALAARWSEASHELFAPAGRWPELRDWLAQFGGHGGREAGAVFALRLEQQRKRRLSPEAALMLLIRWLHPGADAVYLGIRVNPVWLPYIAGRAMGADVSRRPPGSADEAKEKDLDQGQAVRIIEDLWDHELLPGLDQAPDGSGLAGIDTRWRAHADDWDRARRQAAAINPDLELELQRWQGPTLSAWLLWLAVDSRHEAQLRGMVTAAQREVRAALGQPRARLDWFDEVVNRAVNPAALLAAYAAAESARAEARRIRRARDVELATQQAREKAWRQLQLARDWDRSVALGWAASSAAIVAAGWFVLLQLMSVFRAAPEVSVSRAWIFASCAALLQLVIELSVAAAIGGPYYPRFSLMSWIGRAAGRTGRTFSRSGLVASLVASTAALAVVVAATAALSVVTATVPFLLPLIIVPAHAVDAYRRHRDWRSYYNRRRAQVREGLAHRHSGRSRRPRTHRRRQMSCGKAGLIGLPNLAVSNAGNAAAQAAAAHATAVHAAWANAAYMAAPMHGGAAAAGTAAMHAALAAVGTGVFAIGAAAGAVVVTRAAMSGLVTFSERLEAGAAAWCRPRTPAKHGTRPCSRSRHETPASECSAPKLRKAGGTGERRRRRAARPDQPGRLTGGRTCASGASTPISDLAGRAEAGRAGQRGRDAGADPDARRSGPGRLRPAADGPAALLPAAVPAPRGPGTGRRGGLADADRRRGRRGTGHAAP